MFFGVVGSAFEMRVIVCIKQVPDTTSVRMDPETRTLIREGVPSIVNPFDMYAIEEGLRLKERHGGSVTVITMGPPQAESALREAISLGVDDAVHLCDAAFKGSDTLATSYILSAGIRRLGRSTWSCAENKRATATPGRWDRGSRCISISRRWSS